MAARPGAFPVTFLSPAVRPAAIPLGPVRPRLELLEDRTAPAVTLIYGGASSVLSLTESASGATPDVTISEIGSNQLQINLNGNTFAAGSTGTAGGLTYQNAGSPTTSTFATVNITSANQIANLLASLPGDFVSLGPIYDVNGGVSNLNIAANFIFIPSGDTIDTTNAAASAGNIALIADTILQVNAGSTLRAKNGSITLKGNEGGTPRGGNFIAVGISGGTIQTTGAGNILLEGVGSNDATTGSHIGVLVSNSGGTGGTVQAAGTGAVTLDGVGGQGTGGDFGVDVTGANTTIQAAGGALTITGQGGAGVGATSFDVGVQITSGAQVIGTGTTAVRITGTGGPGTGSDFASMWEEATRR